LIVLITPSVYANVCAVRRAKSAKAPMQYLTDWRMTLARHHLRRGELTIAQIAASTGYASPYAFAAAFRRHHGHPPGQWRQRELDRPDIDQAEPADIHTR
jgi:AraC-like DNA-binding protein